MVKIRFTQDRVVQDGNQGTPHETRFSAGQVVDLAEASANHWLSRGAAERMLPTEEPSAPPAPSASSAATQPSLDLTGAPVSDADEQQRAADGDAGGSSDAASADALESTVDEAGSPASEVQPGLGLGGASEADGEKAGKSERKPARGSAKVSRA
jgi:hypothetical protein